MTYTITEKGRYVKAPRSKKSKSIEQEQFELAIAISKSLVDNETEYDMERTIIHREIVDIENQIKNLQVVYFTHTAYDTRI